MNFLYNIAIQLAKVILKAIAPFNKKIKKGVLGRKATFNILEKAITKTDKTLWFHCASLGEYEQGLPVFEALRSKYCNHKIILSFFSPSGYEIRKNSPVADIVVYLPIDTKKNAKKFLNIVNPELSVFVKYDIWPNFLNTLKKRQLNAILISAVFRKNQIYFKFYGKKFKQALFAFSHIFTQDENSKNLLNNIDYNNTTVSGDTRFDRVSNQLKQNNALPYIETFKNNKICIVAGSTWPEGERFLSNFINNNPELDVKYIIAPHNIKKTQILNLKDSLKCETALFSEKENSILKDAKVFIVDTIGILSKIYNYANIAYVGGAIGNTGLHNTLEPAVFGIPIIIGNNYKNFPEAFALIKNGGMFTIANQTEFNKTLFKLITDKTFCFESGKKNALYVKENSGAVIQILNYLRI